MDIDFMRIHEWLASELEVSRPIAESMSRLIAQCEAELPHPDWTKLRSLPYADLSPLLSWIQTPFRDQPPATPLKGLWFGLFNPCPDGETPVADLYVSGSERFEPDPDNNEWACTPEWWPESRYANSEVLANIYRIAYGNGTDADEAKDRLGNNAEYFLCLGYGAFAVQELLRQIEPSLLLGKSDSLGVAVGFDDGDFLLLGQFGASGLIPLS